MKKERKKKREKEREEEEGRRFKVLAWISSAFLLFSWCIKVCMAKLGFDTLLNHSFSMLICVMMDYDEDLRLKDLI